jgi:hypothetical protein
MSREGTDDLTDRIREIMSMDRADCADALSGLPGVTPPPRLRAETLHRILAYEVQARALGGLSARERRALRALAAGKTGGGSGADAATPGSQLVRDWNGRTYRVAVTEAGYVLDGTTYASLSAVARRITGTAWSGPRFFGLKGRRSA